jgi:beta-lactamase regulating signal transducer with metallopeptidase domain/thiol-disulfide isomerase/thioredoxin
MNAHLAPLVVSPAELGAVAMLLAKITLLLAAAWLVQATLGRLNPRWRVLVWRVTGSAIVLLCVLAMSPPFVRLSILPGPTPELAARAALANPATSLDDRAGLRDTSRRVPAASDTTATEAEQLTQPGGSEGIDPPARPRIAHADPAPGAPHAVDAMPERKPASSDGTPAVARAMPYVFWLLGIWCAGAGLNSLWTFIGLLRLRAIRRNAGSVPDWLHCEAARVAGAMGVVRGFELRQTQSLQTPCLVGVLGPMILLPARQCESQYRDELPAILAHELAHLKGGDLFWNALLQAVGIGLWLHPLAWRMRLAHADACDAVCDALASDYVGDARVYGRTLARLTLRITGSGAAHGLAMARVSSVERRIAAVRRHVFRTSLSRRRAALAVAIAAVAIAVLGGLVLVPSQAEPPSATASKAVAAKEEPTPALTQSQKSLTVVATASPGADEPPSAGKSLTLEKVFAAWKARQERIKSFYFVWNLRVALPKGYRFPFTRGLAGVRREDVALGDKDVEFAISQSEWSGEGLERLRSDFSEFICSGAEGWKETGRFRITQAGSLNSRLHVPTRSGEAPTIAMWRKVAIKRPSGWSSSGDFLLQDLEIDLAPLRLALRPLSPASDWSGENSRVVSEDALIGNVHCIKLQMDKVDHSEQCWVDPSRDYCVVRWERRQSEGAHLTVAIDAVQGADHEWLPARWSWRLTGGPAGPAASFEATVTRHMVNKKLPDTTFAADYPGGTRVYDATVDLPIVESDDLSGMLPPDEARTILNAIADAWLQRQAKVKRFRYTWRRDGSGRDSKGKTLNTFCVDGEKLMTEFKTPDEEGSPSPPLDKKGRAGLREGWPIHQSKTVFDGVTTHHLSFSNNPQRPSGVLDIQGCYNDSYFGMPGDRYLRLIFRPFDAHEEGILAADLRDPAKFRVRRQRGQIGNIACVVIDTDRNAGMYFSYWLDPARDYIPLRQHRTVNGEDRQRLDLSYQADAACGWAPVGWTDTTVGMGGKVLSPITDTLSEFTINQPIPASDFQIETPPGVRVQDWRNDRAEQRREAARAAWLAKRKPIVARKEAREKAHPKPKPKPVYDPFADAAADVEAAFKVARETNKRVLIEFGANWCPGCRDLGVVLKENTDVSTALKRDFVLVLVDTDTESGRQLQEKYVPKRQRNSIPHLAVLDPSGKVLKNDDTTAFEVDDDYSVPKLKAFLAQWSPPK